MPPGARAVPDDPASRWRLRQREIQLPERREVAPRSPKAARQSGRRMPAARYPAPRPRQSAEFPGPGATTWLQGLCPSRESTFHRHYASESRLALRSKRSLLGHASPQSQRKLRPSSRPLGNRERNRSPKEQAARRRKKDRKGFPRCAGLGRAPHFEFAPREIAPHLAALGRAPPLSSLLDLERGPCHCLRYQVESVPSRDYDPRREPRARGAVPPAGR